MLRVIGNLPYNISSPLLFHLAQFDANLRDVTVMLQKEVVQRMAAAPATPEYGRLSVMLQVRFRVERLFVVPAGAFRPPPKVESAVARLTPLGAARPALADDALFAQVVAAAFGQRRKTLRNALKPFADEAALETRRHRPGRARRNAGGCRLRPARQCAGGENASQSGRSAARDRSVRTRASVTARHAERRRSASVSLPTAASDQRASTHRLMPNDVRRRSAATASCSRPPARATRPAASARAAQAR